MEKCNVEKISVVAKGEAAKHFKIGTYTEMKKYRRCDKCGKYLSNMQPKKTIECSKY